MIWTYVTALALLVGGGIIAYLYSYVGGRVITDFETGFPLFYTGTNYGVLKALVTYLPFVVLLIVGLYVIVNSRKAEGVIG